MRWPRRLRPRLHVRRCVACRERLNKNGMRLHQIGTVCPDCWHQIRGWRRILREALHHHHVATGTTPVSDTSSRETARP